MRYEEKISNGKLVCIEASVDGGIVRKVSITGDFFLHPEETITQLEDALKGVRTMASEAEISAKLNTVLKEAGAQIIGVSPEDLARIFKKAIR